MGPLSSFAFLIPTTLSSVTFNFLFALTPVVDIGLAGINWTWDLPASLFEDRLWMEAGSLLEILGTASTEQSVAADLPLGGRILYSELDGLAVLLAVAVPEGSLCSRMKASAEALSLNFL